MAPVTLFELNPTLDRQGAREKFQRLGRVQIKDFLTPAAAATIHALLSRQTPWGVAYRAGEDGPHAFRARDLARFDSSWAQQLTGDIGAAMAAHEYAFLYAQYPILTAYLEKWDEQRGLELLIEHINDDPLLSLVREVTGMPQLLKADAQATLYAPTHFLALHDDSHKEEGWAVAYVMNFCAVNWRPDWGGYLTFYDENGDIEHGYKPRFNALNMFRVPRPHNVTYVPPFAPAERLAITGWFRDR